MIHPWKRLGRGSAARTLWEGESCGSGFVWSSWRSVGAGTAPADRDSRPREPDPAALVQGDWVVAAVEHEGVVTPQFDSPAERRINRIHKLIHKPSDRDKAADLPPPERGLPRDTLVYRFGGGRFTVFQDFRPVGWGRYRFRTAARLPSLELTWEQSPSDAPREDRYQGLVRFNNETMEWCLNTEHTDRPPTRFAAEKRGEFIITFQRVR